AGGSLAVKEEAKRRKRQSVGISVALQALLMGGMMAAVVVGPPVPRLPANASTPARVGARAGGRSAGSAARIEARAGAAEFGEAAHGGHRIGEVWSAAGLGSATRCGGAGADDRNVRRSVAPGPRAWPVAGGGCGGGL